MAQQNLTAYKGFSFGKIILILDGLFIYLIAGLSLLLFLNNKFTSLVWETVFSNSIFVPLGLIIVYYAVVFVLTIIFSIFSLGNKYTFSSNEAVTLIKIQLIIRLLQIAAYAFLFFVGLMGTLLIFTIGISLAIVILDGMSIAITGISSVGVYAILANMGMITKKEQLFYSIGGFIFILDVITVCLCYKTVIQSKKFLKSRSS